MIIDRAQAKMAARNCMRTARISPYQISLLYLVIAYVLSAFQVNAQNNGVEYYWADYMTVTMPGPIGWFIIILTGLLATILSAGFITYCLAIRRGKEMPLTTLFDGFSMAGKLILLQVVMGIFVFLWTMLFIIPGIVAAYRYRFALYNLLENPDMGIMEAINLSKQQTMGYKWQLFVLDLSFLGWCILSVFTLGLLLIWLQPYMTLTDIAFYDTICAEKGLYAGGQSGAQQSAANETNGCYDYAGSARNSQWSPIEESESVQTDAAPAEADAPKADVPPAAEEGETPAQSTEDPWKSVKEDDPWKRFDENNK